MKAASLVATVLVLGISPAAAQDRQPVVLDAEALPVSLERIKRQLGQTPALDRETLRLNFYLDVYADKPQLDVFAGFDLHNSPVPYGAPTHQDVLDLVTPLEFRSPPADLTGILNWLVGRGRQKPDK